MEPIKIKKIKPEKLKAINETYALISFEPTNDKEKKAQRSILMDVRRKMLNKEVALTPSTKTVSVAMKYHEAVVLESWLRMSLIGEIPSYEMRLISSFADELNQKLT